MPPSVSCAKGGLEAGVAWLSTHADHREAEGHMGTEHKTCCPLLGLRDRKTAATKQDRTGVCVCVCTYISTHHPCGRALQRCSALLYVVGGAVAVKIVKYAPYSYLL